MITNITTSELKNPRYIKPLRVSYTQNGIDKEWELVKSFDSVAILLYHEEKKSFLLVKQFRPPVFLNQKDCDGFTYELCAGLVDKNKSLVEIAKEEIFGTIEAVKTVSDLFMPISGSVTEFNAELETTPEFVNSDPYGKGWIVKVTITNPSDLEGLLDAAAYSELVGA
jgi:hypothetical protein